MEFDQDLADEQEAALQYMLRPESDNAALLAWDMGLGKTRTGVLLVKAQNTECVLVVIPLQTMESWKETVEQEHPSLPVFVINSSKPGKAALAGFQWRSHGAYLITHEYWERLAWVKELVPKRRKADEDTYRKVWSDVWSRPDFTLIYDESHRSANSGNWTFRALMNLDPGVFKVAMSGTFAGDSFDGAYGASKWLWPHRTDILPNDVFAWRRIWAETKYNKWAPRNEKVVGEKDEGAFVSALPCYIRMESDEPPALLRTVTVDLYPEQRRVYDELDNRMVAWINDNPLVAEYDITKRARQRQTTLAMPTLTFDDETGELLEVTFDDDAESVKTDQLIAEIEGRGQLGGLLIKEPLILLTDSQKFARLLTARLNAHFGGDVAREWSGPISRNQRKQTKADFIEGRVEYLVGVQAAMGTGTDGLQHRSHIVVFMSLSDRRIHNEQGIGRVRRKGQKHQTHAITLIAQDTVDSGQASKQMTDAVKMAKSMRAKHRREQEEARRERART